MAPSLTAQHCVSPGLTTSVVKSAPPASAESPRCPELKRKLLSGSQAGFRLPSWWHRRSTCLGLRLCSIASAVGPRASYLISLNLIFLSSKRRKAVLLTTWSCCEYKEDNSHGPFAQCLHPVNAQPVSPPLLVPMRLSPTCSSGTRAQPPSPICSSKANPEPPSGAGSSFWMPAMDNFVNSSSLWVH